MNNIPYIINRDSLVAVIDGEAYNIAKSHPKFDAISDALQRELPKEEILPLFQTARQVREFTDGEVEVRGGLVYHKGEEVGGPLVDRILEFMGDGLPHKPLIRFLERLQRNPSYRSREQLYNFLEHRNLPITPEGKFLAYKSVSPEYLDHHTGKISNKPGTIIKMERRRISDDADMGCHYGLHVGALEYAEGFGGEDRKVVICELDPEHVVCVPNACDCQKMRVCEYRVVADYSGPLNKPLMSPDSILNRKDDLYSADEIIILS